VLCFPLVIFGLVSGSWQPVLISIAITCGVVIAAFKVIEHKFKKSVMGAMPNRGDERLAPPAAGPLEPEPRRQRIDRLLAAEGLPKLAEVEPLFEENPMLDFLEK
jgi:hypothetical protein